MKMSNLHARTSVMKAKSPIREIPLPQPGDSSQTIMEDRWFDRVMLPLLVTSLLGMLAVMEWLDLAFKHSPWIWTVLFVASAFFTASRYRSMKIELRQRHQGIQGERIVGQLLENMRSLGCKIYHDISEEKYNIDHVIIGPHGVFSIETKAPSMPSKGRPTVDFDGETVTVGAYKPEKDPVIQARAAARRVQAILRQMTGQEIHVTPVLLYVNWFVEPSIRDNSIVVMNQIYFYKTFDRLQDRNALPATQVDFLAAALERYLREKTR
jgi:Nuclease-related domain